MPVVDIASKTAIALIAEEYQVKPTAVLDLYERFEIGDFTVGNLGAYLEKAKADDTRPHWFKGAKPGSETELEHNAFVLGNATAQSEYAKTHSPDELIATAERYNNPAARGIFGKPGTAAAATETDKEASAKNPFSNHPNNIDPRTGRYNASAIRRQCDMIGGPNKKGLGEKVVAGIAASVGARLGDVYAPGFGPGRKTNAA